MSESSRANAGGDGIPEWMKAVNDENLYTTAPTEEPNENVNEKKSTAPETGLSTTGQRRKNSEIDATAPFQKKLSLAMGDPQELPNPDPDVQPTNVGQVRSELNRWLDRAVAILNTRYDREISKTLILEFVIRRELVDLHVHGEDSPVVEWLDSVLPRS